MQKPGYTTTKKALWLSSALAWIVILTLTAGAIRTGAVIAFAQIALPMMVGLVAVMLGIHRGLGSLDLWTMARHLPDEPDVNSGQPGMRGHGEQSGERGS